MKRKNTSSYIKPKPFIKRINLENAFRNLSVAIWNEEKELKEKKEREFVPREKREGKND